MPNDYPNKMEARMAFLKKKVDMETGKSKIYQKEHASLIGPKYADSIYNGNLRCVRDPNPQCSDLSLLLKNRYNSTIQAPFDCMSASIQDGNTWSLIDLEKMQALIDESFRYLHLYKKYDTLSSLSNGTLHFDEEGFHIEEHTFQTLEEVEKALKHKAFL